LVGHNSHEGNLFIDPSIATDSAFNAYISNKLFSFLSPASQEHLIKVLYPPRYDGSNGYKTVKERLGLLISEAFIGCNAFGLANAAAHGNGSFGYMFAVPPGLHGQDIAYSFFTPGNESPNVENVTVAMELQGYLTRFARTGNPNGADGDTPIPEYKQGEMILKVGSDGSTSVRDDMGNGRCQWWQKNF
jgi:carboxylesterase type B